MSVAERRDHRDRPGHVGARASLFKQNDVPFPCLADPDRRVFRVYDVKSAMISLARRQGLYVIDGAGVLRFAYLGFQQWEIPTVDDTLKQIDLLNG